MKKLHLNKDTMNKKSYTGYLKAILIVGATILFQVLIYFITKIFQGSPHMLNSKLDNAFPYIAEFVYFYIIWYLLLFIVPILLYKKDKRNFKIYILTYFVSIILAGIIFIVYPTGIVRPDINTNNLSNILVGLLYRMDTPAINCLPSIHCIMAFLFMLSIISSKNINKKFKWTISIVSIIIIWSTLFIKQHVIYDVLASLVITLPVWCVSNKIIIKR